MVEGSPNPQNTKPQTLNPQPETLPPFVGFWIGLLFGLSAMGFREVYSAWVGWFRDRGLRIIQCRGGGGGRGLRT